jgi:hypothetical protein
MEFRAYLEHAFDDKQVLGKKLSCDFYLLEYMNSPLGLIVYAHHGMNGCEAFYPSAIDFEKVTGIRPFPDMIEPAGHMEGPFVRHTMSRKTTGFLIHAAYGRMVNAGDPEAPSFDLDFERLEFYDSPRGLIIGAELKDGRFYVIRPAGDAEARQAA